MTTFLKDLARGYGRSAVIALLSLVVGLPVGCGCVFIALAALSAADYAGWAVAIVAVVYLLGLTVVAVGIPLAAVLRRKSRLDALFVPLGLQGGAYQTFFRQYHGQVRGRQVDVYLRRGPVLEIEVVTPLRTRLGAARSEVGAGVLAGVMGRQALSIDDPAWSDLDLYAIDEGWARVLAGSPGAGDLLHRLTEASGDFTRQQVILRPGAAVLLLTGNRRLFGLYLAPGLVQRWLEDLIALTSLAESLPAPTVTDELTSTEEFAQGLRGRNPYLALWIGLGTGAVIVVVGFAIAAAILLLDRLGG